jgi:hypothetical protein
VGWARAEVMGAVLEYLEVRLLVGDLHAITDKD